MFQLSNTSVSYTSEDEAQQMFVQSESDTELEGREMSRESPVESLMPEQKAEELSMWDSLKIVMSSALWRNTAIAISLTFFITSAVAYLWENTVESVWDFNDDKATVLVGVLIP